MVVAALSILSCVGILLAMLLPGWQQYISEGESAEATAAAERALTEEHGVEVQIILEDFQSRVGAFETKTNPQLLSEIAAGPLLERLQSSRGDGVYDSSTLLVSDAVLDGVRVLEYDTDRFKAIGCGFIHYEEVTSDGELVKTLASHHFRILYVFARGGDDTWKAVAFIDILDISENYARDWEYVPDWAKQELGDVREHFYKDCLQVSADIPGITQTGQSSTL